MVTRLVQAMHKHGEGVLRASFVEFPTDMWTTKPLSLSLSLSRLSFCFQKVYRRNTNLGHFC